MTKEELKALGLTDEQVEKVVEDYGKNYVSKVQFNAKNEAFKFEKEERGKLAKEIESLKKNHQDNVELTKQIADLQNSAKEREKEYKNNLENIKFDMALERTLANAKARNTKAVRALLDLKNLKLDNKGEIQGLNEQIEELQKSQGYLFEETQSLNGYRPRESGDGASENTVEAFKAALGSGI